MRDHVERAEELLGGTESPDLRGDDGAPIHFPPSQMELRTAQVHATLSQTMALAAVFTVLEEVRDALGFGMVRINLAQDGPAADVPGSTAEQLPDHLLELVDVHLPPYKSTACETAAELKHVLGMTKAKPHVDELTATAERLHARCRINQKFTGQLCVCRCHADAGQQQDTVKPRGLIAGLGLTPTPPDERCGELTPELFGQSPREECVLRPGHSGSHAAESGARWWATVEVDLPGKPHHPIGDGSGQCVCGEFLPCPHAPETDGGEHQRAGEACT